MSFSDGPKIIENGKIAAKIKIDELTALRERQIKKPTDFKVENTPDSLQINLIYFEGLKNYTISYALGKLKLKPFEKVSYDRFISGTNNLVATNNFDSFTYKLVPSTYDGIQGYDLYTEMVETKKTASIKFGLHYDGLYKSALLANVTKTQLLFKNDVLSLDLIMGDNVRYNFEYYIDKGFYWSVGVKSRYNEFNKGVAASALLTPEQLAIAGVNQLGVKVTDLTNKIFLQTQYENDLTLTLGAEHKRYKITTETVISSSSENNTVFDKSDYVSAFANLRFDSFDNRYFPNNGIYFNSDFNFYGYSSDFNKDFSEFSVLKADLGYAYSFSSKFSANLFVEAGAKIGAGDNTYLNFVLGGYAGNFINNFESFYGYDYLSIPGNSFLKGTLDVDYEIFNKHHITLAANYANVANDLFSSEDIEWFSIPNYSGYAVGYGIETFLGPIEAKYTFSP
ncbi:hypothetical protein [Lacinutrix neustonica]|uniref:hypothetical protein n=1 Tax=Lacinutrix neustonica TaxID=2980107 RepID=UPI0028BF5135|nr:hypothetical protein [Lacinutrix neustonica]